MQSSGTSEISLLLQRLRQGDHGALEELMPLVYAELRRIARASMARQPFAHTLQPTALVHEAFVKVFQSAQPQIADRPISSR